MRTMVRKLVMKLNYVRKYSVQLQFQMILLG